MPRLLRLHLGSAPAGGGRPSDGGEPGPGASPGGTPARMAGARLLQTGVATDPVPGALRCADRCRRGGGSGRRGRRGVVRIAAAATLNPSLSTISSMGLDLRQMGGTPGIYVRKVAVGMCLIGPLAVSGVTE